MARRRLLPTLTPARIRWLRKLRAAPGTERTGHGIVAYDCMRLGWTQWRFRDVEGEYLSEAEAVERFGQQMWNRVEVAGEMLTQAGQDLLDNIQGGPSDG